MTAANTFSEVFKKLRLQAGINSLGELCELLVNYDFVLEESTLSRWQGGSRVPNNRKLLLALIKIFTVKGAISTTEEANKFLFLANLPNLFEQEEKELSLKNRRYLVFHLPPEQNIIGIEYILSQVRAQLIQNSGHMKMVLYGLPGTGKSSSAISIGHRFQSFFQKGVIWVRVLDKDIQQISNEIKDILCGNINGSISAITKSTNFLIIFDNVQSEEILSDIVRIYSYSSFLITTNFQPKFFDHLTVVKVNPFDNKHSIKLFSRYARKSLTKDETKIVIEIAKQLGNLPLPLSIIANTLRGALNKNTLQTTLDLIMKKQKGQSFFRENFSQIILAFELLFDQLSQDEKKVLETIAQNNLLLFKSEDIKIPQLDLTQVQWTLFKLSTKSLIDKASNYSYKIHPVLYRFLKIKLE